VKVGGAGLFPKQLEPSGNVKIKSKSVLEELQDRTTGDEGFITILYAFTHREPHIVKFDV
jgi:hypothetical protein